MTSEPTIERGPEGGAGKASRRRSLATIFFGSKEQRVEAVAIVILILAGVGWWTYAGVRDSLATTRSAYLRGILDAKVAALESWMRLKRAETERWAAVPEVVNAVRTLDTAARNGAGRAALAASPAQVEFARTLAPAVRADPERVAANAVDRAGRIIAASAPAQIGLGIGSGMRNDLNPVFAGESRFLAPRPERERSADAQQLVFPRPVVWFAAPLRDTDGQIVAALEIGTYADARFAQIVAPAAAADDGSTTDAYAFDDTGLKLTSSRYPEVLRAAGLIPPHAISGAFNLRLRDPGVDLRNEPKPEDLGERPLTELVRRAIAARGASEAADRRGLLLEPYRNYIGREVIGAWQWLPEYRMGIAVEVAASEAFGAMRYLATALQVIFGLLVLAVAVALASSFSLADLKRQERQLGPYRLEAKIEEGGMATVHRAVHALLKRPTAIKILKPHLATDELIARFEREVQLASRLEHPATIEIFDYGRTRDGTFFYAMEYIDGLTLAKLVDKDGAQPVPRVAHVLKQVCESLREAHAKGLIHRDIKPANVMLCERGGESDVVKVLDFGLIKDVHATDTRDITQYSRLLGTPTYMAPERIRNPSEATPAVDVYAVGAVAFYLLTAKRVFDAPNELELARQVLELPAPRASSAAKQPIPKALDDLIARCLAKDPAERPERVEELIAAFAALLQAHPWKQEAAERWWHDYRGGQEAAAV
jgi:serine/threonine-protein kinase